MLTDMASLDNTWLRNASNLYVRQDISREDFTQFKRYILKLARIERNITLGTTEMLIKRKPIFYRAHDEGLDSMARALSEDFEYRK